MSESSRERRPDALRLARGPILLSLAVVAVRLLGELLKLEVELPGDVQLFSREGGGGQSPLGMTTLLPLFGFYFGWRLGGGNHGPRWSIGRFLLSAAAGAILVGGIFLFVFHPMWSSSGLPLVLAMIALSAIAMPLAWEAWPAHARASLCLALATRIPIVLMTTVAVAFDLDTHFARIGPDIVDPPTEKVEIAVGIAIAQLTVWPALTLAVGGLCGWLGAAMRKLWHLAD